MSNKKTQQTTIPEEFVPIKSFTDFNPLDLNKDEIDKVNAEIFQTYFGIVFSEENINKGIADLDRYLSVNMVLRSSELNVSRETYIEERHVHLSKYIRYIVEIFNQPANSIERKLSLLIHNDLRKEYIECKELCQSVNNGDLSPTIIKRLIELFTTMIIEILDPVSDEIDDLFDNFTLNNFTPNNIDLIYTYMNTLKRFIEFSFIAYIPERQIYHCASFANHITTIIRICKFNRCPKKLTDLIKINKLKFPNLIYVMKICIENYQIIELKKEEFASK